MAHNIYKLDAAGPGSFDGQGAGGAIDLSTVIDFTINETGDVTTSNSNGSVYVQGDYVDNIRGVVTVNMADVSQLVGLPTGDWGTLVLRGKKRTNGSGVATETLVITATRAALVSVTSTTPDESESSGTVTFNLSDQGEGSLYTAVES